MKRHDTHNISSSEEGHSYIFPSQSPSEYSKINNDIKLNINKNKEISDIKNCKNNNLLLDKNNKEKNKKENKKKRKRKKRNEKTNINELTDDKNKLNEQENNYQENIRNINNSKSNYKENNIEKAKVEDNKKNEDKDNEEEEEDENIEEEENIEIKNYSTCKNNHKDIEDFYSIKKLPIKKYNSFEIKKHPQLEKENSNTKNIIKSQPSLDNIIKPTKPKKLPKIILCYFTKNKKLIQLNRNIYKEFFENLKDIELTTSEAVTKIKNEIPINEGDNDLNNNIQGQSLDNKNIINSKEEENENNININNNSDEEKNNINDNYEEVEYNANINGYSNTNEENFNSKNNTKGENANTNINNDITDIVEDEENKIIAKNKNQFYNKLKNMKDNTNTTNNIGNQRNSKIKIYKRQENNNKNQSKFKKKENKDYSIEAYNNIIPGNIKRIINPQNNHEEKKKESKEVRILKFNKNKTLLQNKEINNVINAANKNRKNQNKKSLSISNTPKNLLILKKNKSNKKTKIKTTNNNNDKSKNKSNTIIKETRNYLKDNNIKNKINKYEEEKRKIFLLDSKQLKKSETKDGNKNKKKNELYSKNVINNNHRTIPITFEKISKKYADNKILMKRIKKKNIIAHEEIKQDELMKKDKNKMKKNIDNRNQEKEKDDSTNKVNSSNRTATNIINKNKYEMKILSHRSFQKPKKISMNKFPQIIMNNNRTTCENNSKPNNLKLKLSDSAKKNNEKITLSKKSRLNALQNYIKNKRNKNNIKINNIFKDNDKSKRNNIISSNNINPYNNDNPLFKTIQKQHIHHIKKFKKDHYNILSMDKFQLKENNDIKKFGKLDVQKKNIKKVNIINLNRVKSSYFEKKTVPNSRDLEFKLNFVEKKRANNSIFLYTKHYGDPSKCPLCQSMEMKAKYSESKLGLYLAHFKHSNEESKLSSNYSSIKNNLLSGIKNNKSKDTKDSRNFSFKGDLSPINMNSTNDKYFQNSREQIAFNILRNKMKNDKLEINDFPVFDKYFNS